MQEHSILANQSNTGLGIGVSWGIWVSFMNFQEKMSMFRISF